MNKIPKFLILMLSLLFMILIMPVLSLAQDTAAPSSGLVPCGTATHTYKIGDVITPAKTTIITNPYSNTAGTPQTTPAVIATSEITLVTNPCDFNFFMDLINNIINFILYFMAIPIAAIMFAYAGFDLVISGGEASKRTQAKNIFTNAVLGLILAAASWLIIKYVLMILGYNGTWIGFK